MIELFLAAQALSIPDSVPVHDQYDAVKRVPSLELTTPEQYKGPATTYVIFVEQKDVVKWCGRAEVGLIKMGCMLEDPRSLVLSNPCDEDMWPEVNDKRSYAHYVCHEKAHVNGWRH